MLLINNYKYCTRVYIVVTVMQLWSRIFQCTPACWLYQSWLFVWKKIVAVYVIGKMFEQTRGIFIQSAVSICDIKFTSVINQLHISAHIVSNVVCIVVRGRFHVLFRFFCSSSSWGLSCVSIIHLCSVLSFLSYMSNLILQLDMKLLP